MPDCPERYRRFLEDHGGRNCYGEAAFLLHWGSLPVPRGISAPQRYQMPSALLAPYLNCWCLAEWTPPNEFGDPQDWDETNGPFLSEGVYLPIQIFREGNEPI